MAKPQEGDSRVITVSGHVRRTLNGITKFAPGQTFQVRQEYRCGRTISFGDTDVRFCKWIDVEFID